MFIVYFALWVILNGKWTTEIGIFGVMFSPPRCTGSAADSWGTASRRIFIICADSRRRFVTARRCWREIFKANVTVIRMILDRTLSRSLSSCILKAVWRKLRHRVVLADSITPDAGHDHLPARGRPLSGALPRRGDGGRTG